MTLDWTTFFLEILNFLVLVWILKHFFYRPVLNVIAARRAGIEKTLADAHAVEAQAQALKRDYEARAASWQQERDAARAALAEEMAAEREHQMSALSAALAAEREKARALEEKRQTEWRRAAEEQAIALGAAFAARLLARVATPALEANLIDAALADLPQVPPGERAAFAASASDARRRALVTSAFPLDDAGRTAVAAALTKVSGGEVEAEFNQSSDLLAGLRVSLGSWVLHANLRDELKFFAAVA